MLQSCSALPCRQRRLRDLIRSHRLGLVLLVGATEGRRRRRRSQLRRHVATGVGVATLLLGLLRLLGHLLRWPVVAVVHHVHHDDADHHGHAGPEDGPAHHVGHGRPERLVDGTLHADPPAIAPDAGDEGIPVEAPDHHPVDQRADDERAGTHDAHDGPVDAIALLQPGDTAIDADDVGGVGVEPVVRSVPVAADLLGHRHQGAGEVLGAGQTRVVGVHSAAEHVLLREDLSDPLTVHGQAVGVIREGGVVMCERGAVRTLLTIEYTESLGEGLLAFQDGSKQLLCGWDIGHGAPFRA